MIAQTAERPSEPSGTSRVRRRGLGNPHIMETLTETDRTIVLRALFELAVSVSGFDNTPGRAERLDHVVEPEQIAALVRKLDGDPDVPRFGIE